MAGTVISGKDLASEIRDGLASRVSEVQKALGRPPGLSVLLVGDDPASQVYVRNKEKAAAKIGLKGEVIRLPASSTQQEVIAAVDRLNEDPTVDAFLVQLPLPAHLDANAVTERINPHKDGDGLHPVNLGRLMAGMPAPRPCTPSGVMALLEKGGVELEGKRAVVVGRSTIVGKPQAMLLLEKNATVTLCHSRTEDLAGEVARADVVVAAVGRPELIKGAWIKQGAAVIDVGVNRVGNKLVGDVEFGPAAERAALITPVPGGVGPMTIAMLLTNAVRAAESKAESA